MKRLTLLRHAKSSWKEPSGSDVDRPLNRRGKRDAPDMGRRLAKARFLTDAVITSPARRARKTARLVASEIGFADGDIMTEERIYEADVGDLVGIVREFDETLSRVLLVGHNPGFTDLANRLSGERIPNVPTCGVVVIEFPVRSWKDVGRGKGRMVHFDFPKNLPE